jgi:hypothetical protein
MGPILGAELPVVVGKISAFESADRSASYAGPFPAARDSGKKRIGNNERMRGWKKVLKRVFYQSGFANLRSTPESKVFYVTAREPKARGILRLSSLWRLGGSTCCGRCCVTKLHLRAALRLEVFIEILPGILVSKGCLCARSSEASPTKRRSSACEERQGRG